MIYKFIDKTKTSKNLEVERKGEEVKIVIIDHSSEKIMYVSLDKEDIFKLIGALHCIQKELK